MLKVIIVDDEKLALKELENLLADYQDIVILAKYADPVIALKEIESLKPDIIFLDICMPQMNGIDFATKVNITTPGTKIVFITADDSYAVKAFDLNAADYLLKPIKKDRLEQTIQRVTAGQLNTGRKLIIKCFGDFFMGWEGQEPIKWRTEKTKELFAFLLHNCGKSVSKYEIIDAVWPDTDPEKAEHQLHNGIYYIRKNLQEYGIPRESVLLTGNYYLTLSNVYFDRAFIHEYLFKSIKTLPIGILERIEKEYAGNYFNSYDWPWAEFDRQIYSRYYFKVAYKLSESYYNNGEHEKAERLLEKIIRINPYDEQPVLLLAKILISFNRKVEAMLLIDSFTKTLKKDLDISPGEELKKLLADLSKEKLNHSK
jgi:two-component SAPR family response regulator